MSAEKQRHLTCSGSFLGQTEIHQHTQHECLLDYCEIYLKFHHVEKMESSQALVPEMGSNLFATFIQLHLLE